MSLDTIVIVRISTMKIFEEKEVIIFVGSGDRTTEKLDRSPLVVVGIVYDEVFEVVMQVKIGFVLNRVPVVWVKVVSTMFVE